MEFLLILFIAAVASFIGSLQAGLVNTAVLATTLRSGPVAGRLTAWGGALPEILYAGLAFAGAERLLTWIEGFGGTVDRVAGTVMVLLGLYLCFLLKPFVAENAQARNRSGFWQGLLLGLMNPQLLLFWCGVRVGMGPLGLHTAGPLALCAFALGGFIGAMALLLLLVRLGTRLQARLGGHTLRTVFRIIGGVLVVLGLLAWIRPV
jgi:threonine/homoserine/homoserine lactone efflux protein